MGIEEWRSVIGYEGFYEVSNFGRVRRIKPARGAVPGRILKPTIRKRYGYHMVNLYKNNVSTVFLVHRLVLEAFVGPAPPNTEGCHFDGDGSNNDLDNLRWASSSENNYDMVRMGRSVQANRQHCPRFHPLRDPNLYWVGPNKNRRSCKVCANENSAAQREDREFDVRLADKRLENMDYDLFEAAVDARMAEREMKVLDKELGDL